MHAEKKLSLVQNTVMNWNVKKYSCNLFWNEFWVGFVLLCLHHLRYSSKFFASLSFRWSTIEFTKTQYECVWRAYESRYSAIKQVKFVESSPQEILLGPFLNTLVHIWCCRGKTEFFSENCKWAEKQVPSGLRSLTVLT